MTKQDETKGTNALTTMAGIKIAIMTV